MDLSFLQPFLDAIAGINPVWGAITAVIVYVLRTKGWMRVPGLEPKPVDPNKPLLDRLGDRLKNLFGDHVEAGYDADDVYVAFNDALRGVDLSADEESETEDPKESA